MRGTKRKVKKKDLILYQIPKIYTINGMKPSSHQWPSVDGEC